MNTLFQSNNIFNQMYSEFATKVKSTNQSTRDIKTKFKELELISLAENKTDLFCKESENLANELIISEKQNIANFIMGEIIKLLLHFEQFEQAEKVIKNAIKISTQQNDKLHVLARLTDLEYIYKKQYKRKELFWVLGQKKFYAKEIIKNYDENAKNYQTIKSKATSIDDVKIQLARVYTELARLLKYKKPNDSIKALEKAKGIYEELNKIQEVEYLSKKIETWIN